LRGCLLPQVVHERVFRASQARLASPIAFAHRPGQIVLHDVESRKVHAL
jgi:hypothetical protein